VEEQKTITGGTAQGQVLLADPEVEVDTLMEQVGMVQEVLELKDRVMQVLLLRPVVVRIMAEQEEPVLLLQIKMAG